MVILWGLKPDGAGNWDGGTILDPENGKIYSVEDRRCVDGGTKLDMSRLHGLLAARPQPDLGPRTVSRRSATRSATPSAVGPRIVAGRSRVSAHAIIASSLRIAMPHAPHRRRHLRPALRQRPAAPRPPGRLHPGRHLGARAAHGRRHGAFRLRRRHPRHADHARRGKGRHHARKPSSPASRPAHERDFADFGVAFDHYDSTHSPGNRALTEAIYAKLDANGHIARRAVAQFYDPAKGMFLPDRYIKGICPNCGTPDQYGDNCENCGATYAPTELKEPRSVLSAARRRSCASRSTSSSRSASSRRSCASGWPATSPCPGSRPSCRNGWTPKAACAPGTSRATRRTSASRSPATRASTSTSGSTRRSATSPASRRCASATA